MTFRSYDPNSRLRSLAAGLNRFDVFQDGKKVCEVDARSAFEAERQVARDRQVPLEGIRALLQVDETPREVLP